MHILRWRPALLALALGGAALTASAQAPVPFYSPADAVAGFQRGHAVPHARAWSASSAALVAALQRHCAGPADIAGARAAWTQVLRDWSSLDSVATGPLIERRTERETDFQPMRPELLQRALAREPRTLADLQRVGAPARGLPALEHLLWARPVAPGTPACGYAVLAAQAVAQEAQAVHRAFEALAASPPTDEAAATAFAEIVNQWLGGLERLRWPSLEKPLREAGTRQGPPAWPRAVSGQDVVAWDAQWAALRTLAVAGAGAPPAPGEAAVPIETYLRGRGQLVLAERWRTAVGRADDAMRAITAAATPPDAARVETAASALKTLTTLLQTEVSTALGVGIGFSSADGD